MNKRSLFAVLSLAMAACLLTACTDRDTAVHEDTDSSYYGVNFTDTGDSNNDKISSVTVDHSISSSEYPSSSSTPESRADDSSASEHSSSALSSKSAASSDTSGTSTRTTITYYYYDGEGEHTTDTDLEPDSEVESVYSSSAIETDTDNNSTPVSADSDTDTATDSDTPHSQGEFTDDDLILNYNGAVIACGEKIDDITAMLGEPLNIDKLPYDENPSFERKVYSYEFFSIGTVPSEDGTEYTVSDVQIFDDDVPTDKGIAVGMTRDDIASTYGSDMMIIGDEIRYYSGERYLYFYMTNDVVANIGFGLDNDMISTDSE